MRRAVLIAFTAASFFTVDMEPTFALPPGGLQMNESTDASPQADEARLFCYNRYNGRFLHWGRCGGGYRRRIRVYCRNRYTGRFIHWGAC